MKITSTFRSEYVTSGVCQYDDTVFSIYDIPLKAGRGIGAETCGLDDVFSPDGLGSDLCTPFIFIQNKLFPRDILML